LVPVSNLAEIADKFTRNEIATSNDMRQVIGWKPSPDPKANELRNSNMPQPGNQVSINTGTVAEDSSMAQDALDEVDQAIDQTFATLGVPE
jgi:hypothetical protein